MAVCCEGRGRVCPSTTQDFWPNRARANCRPGSFSPCPVPDWEWMYRPEQSLASHRRIADAIRAQDANAAEAMLEHLELVSDVALLK